MSANLQGLSVKAICRALNVSERQCYYAKELLHRGESDLIVLVEAGEMSLHKALRLARQRQRPVERKPYRRPRVTTFRRCRDEVAALETMAMQEGSS